MLRASYNRDASKGGQVLFSRENPKDYEFYLAQTPLVGDYLKASDTGKYYADYYKNTGITPRYPYMTYPNFGTQLAYSALGMTSHLGYKALSALYR